MNQLLQLEIGKNIDLQTSAYAKMFQTTHGAWQVWNGTSPYDAVEFATEKEAQAEFDKRNKPQLEKLRQEKWVLGLVKAWEDLVLPRSIHAIIYSGYTSDLVITWRNKTWRLALGEYKTDLTSFLSSLKPGMDARSFTLLCQGYEAGYETGRDMGFEAGRQAEWESNNWEVNH